MRGGAARSLTSSPGRRPRRTPPAARHARARTPPPSRAPPPGFRARACPRERPRRVRRARRGRAPVARVYHLGHGPLRRERERRGGFFVGGVEELVGGEQVDHVRPGERAAEQGRDVRRHFPKPQALGLVAQREERAQHGADLGRQRDRLRPAVVQRRAKQAGLPPQLRLLGGRDDGVVSDGGVALRAPRALRREARDVLHLRGERLEQRLRQKDVRLLRRLRRGGHDHLPHLVVKPLCVLVSTKFATRAARSGAGSCARTSAARAASTWRSYP